MEKTMRNRLSKLYSELNSKSALDDVEQHLDKKTKAALDVSNGDEYANDSRNIAIEEGRDNMFDSASTDMENADETKGDNDHLYIKVGSDNWYGDPNIDIIKSIKELKAQIKYVIKK